MGIYLSTPKTEKSSDDGENIRLRFGLSSMQGWRATMEDAHAAILDLDTSTSFFGVYDGHGGKVVAKFCAKYLHQQVLKHEAYLAGDIGTSVQKAFFRMDEMMRGQRGWRELAVLGDKINKFTGMIEGLIWSPRSGDKNDQVDDWAFEEGPHSDFSGPTSGCTACVAIIRENQLVVANAGDSRCVISRNGQAYNLSRDHKPDLEVERDRILKAGGFIHAGRVNGSLNLARAIIDFVGFYIQQESEKLLGGMESKRQKVMKMIPITPWSMDRISQLPQAILHHILSFLSQKEAVRTSVLSKSWRYLWSTLPNIEFRERYFPGNKKTFLSILDKTLQGYHDKKLSIQEFYVEIWTVDSESSLLLEKWIPIVTLNKRLKTFKLCFVSRNSEFLNMIRDSFEQECFQRYFDLPSVVFEAESLEELYLQRCKLSQNPLDKVLFTHLQTLILKRVYIEDETFQKIMSSCPLIANLVIHSCMGLKTIKVDEFHKYLKYFDFHHHVWHSKVPSIEIDIQTLETIKIEDYPNWFHDNRYKYFSHLKSLYLNNVRLSTMSFDYLSRDFPCLEELTLYGCKGIEEFQLSSRSIKHLSIVSSYKSIKAVIAAPNIVNFKCSSNCLPSISFTTNSSEWKSHIHVRFDSNVYDASLWFHKLNELLKELSQSEISLEISRYSSLTNQQVEDIYGCFYEPVVVKHLSLNEYSCSSSQSFLNCLFRICRPIYIRQYMYIDPHAEFVCKNLLMERESRHQDLEEVNMEAFDDNGQEWHPIPGTSLSERALPNEQKIRFRLKWR